MNAKRFKSMLHSRKVKFYVLKQEIDENGQTHIYGFLDKSKR